MSLSALLALVVPGDAFHWLDLAGLALVLLFVVIGARGGLWWQLVRLLGLVACVAVARAVAPRLANGIDEVFAGVTPRRAEGLAWCLVLVAGLLIVALLGRSGSKEGSQGAEHSFLDRIGGALAGAITGVVLHAVLLLVIAGIAEPEWTEKQLSGSRSHQFVSALERGIPGLIDVHAAESLGLPRDAR